MRKFQRSAAIGVGSMQTDVAAYRPTALFLIALGLAAFGIWAAVHIPPILVGPPMPLLLVAFALEAGFGLAAAFAVWTQQSWAGVAVILLGATIAVTALLEAFVLGIVAYLWALLVAIVAIVVAMILAAYVSPSSQRSALRS